MTHMFFRQSSCSRRHTPSSGALLRRLHTNHLILPFPTISSTHAQILTVKRRLYVKDLHSTNGTFSIAFAANGTVWNITVFAYNRTDCWARKAGTKGEQRRTFCRFSTRVGPVRL